MSNKLKNSLNNAEFSVLFEVATPKTDSHLEFAVSRTKPICDAVDKISNFNSGIAFTDKLNCLDSYNILSFADALCGNENRDRHIFFISGTNSTVDDILKLITNSIDAGFTNVIPVSGNPLNQKKLSKRKDSFTESTKIISEAAFKLKENSNLNIGGVVNPFKYSPGNLYTQYFKLLKKIKLGAEFIVSQAGWDMYKYQELRWWLENRGCFIPSLTRIVFLNPEKLDEQILLKNNSVPVSPDFINILKKEAQLGYSQFILSQWRRLQLMISGLKLLGHSGVIINGIESSENIKLAEVKISTALKEFSNFDEWKEAYINFTGRAEMYPYPYKFYSFKNLFNSAFNDLLQPTIMEDPIFSKKEIIKEHLLNFIFSKAEKKDPSHLYFLKKILTGCSKHCDECTLSKNFNVCIKQCPKLMADGPCGEVKINSSCCLSSRECVYSKVFRIASQQKDIHKLEEMFT